MRILVVDDESLARSRLITMIQEMDADHETAEAGNGLEALAAANRFLPHVVLLDIRMPAMDGLETARHLTKLTRSPAVIFTTAYADHALAAFEAQAVDYLLKPVRKERLSQALQHTQVPSHAQLAALYQQTLPQRPRSHVSAALGGRIQLVPVSEIRYFQADQKYVAARWPEGRVLIETPLQTLEAEFRERFFRIHRNALVALPYVAGLDCDAGGHCTVSMRGIEDRLTVSRRHVALLRRHLRDGALAD